MVILSHQTYLKQDKSNTTLRKLFQILLKCFISNRLEKFLNRWHARTLKTTSLQLRKEIIISFCRIKILAYTGTSLMSLGSSILVTRPDLAIFNYYAKTLKMSPYSWPSSSALSATKRAEIYAKILQWQLHRLMSAKRSLTLLKSISLKSKFLMSWHARKKRVNLERCRHSIGRWCSRKSNCRGRPEEKKWSSSCKMLLCLMMKMVKKTNILTENKEHKKQNWTERNV